MTGQHEKYDAQLKEKSEKAFEQLPEEHYEEAEAARTQLLNWLVQMDRITKNPAELVDDTMANTGCNVFEGVLQKLIGDSKKGKWNTLLKAFNGLDDEDQLNLLRNILSATIQAHAKNCALVSRPSDLFSWENTGFHVDGDTKCAHAKVGTHPFQAIGFDDGTRYIGTEGSKTLWAREFGMAIILPWAPPFKVDRVELEEEQPASPTALSDKERAIMEEMIAQFEEDLQAHVVLKPSQKDELKEVGEKMLEGVKLARLRIPRLDQKLDELIDENPEVGANFENVNPVELVSSCTEFLRMKLDDDKIRRDIEATVISTGALYDEQRKLIGTLMDGIAALIPVEGAEPDSSTLMQRINDAAIAMPAIRDLLLDVDPSSDVLEAAKACLVWLQAELDKVPVVMQEDEVSGSE